MHQTRQAQLERKDGARTVSTTCWLPYEGKGKKIKVGSRVSLKGDDEIWVVVGLSEVFDKRPNRGWDNNI